MTSRPLLELRQASIRRGSFRLEVPALTLARGARLALLGPSGSGKSTLLELLALACAPDAAGCFRFTPEAATLDIAAAWAGRAPALDGWRARHIGYVLQSGALLPFLSVAANIGLQAEIAGVAEAGRLAALAGRLGLADQLGKRPAALSVGQRQRAAVARALVHRPALVLADEPTASVDPAMAREVLDLLLAEAEAAGATLVLASHDHAAVARLGLPVMVFETAREAGGTVARAVLR